MKKIIKFIIEQKHESIDEYPSLVTPISEKFGIDLDVAENIINVIIEWECSTTDLTLEETLINNFPDVVTN